MKETIKNIKKVYHAKVNFSIQKYGFEIQFFSQISRYS